MPKRENVKPLMIRDVPVDLRNEAKVKAAVLSIPLREFAIQALREKIAATPS